MPAVRRNVAVQLGWRLHRWLYRLSAGRLGSLLLGWPIILLTTEGRKSGRPRTVALHALMTDDRYVVVASNAGEDRHPDWYLNLLAGHMGIVQHGRARVHVLARVAEGEERARFWELITARDRSYLEYQARTEREIPVVVLEPSGESTPA